MKYCIPILILHVESFFQFLLQFVFIFLFSQFFKLFVVKVKDGDKGRNRIPLYADMNCCVTILVYRIQFGSLTEKEPHTFWVVEVASYVQSCTDISLNCRITSILYYLLHYFNLVVHRCPLDGRFPFYLKIRICISSKQGQD